MSSSSQISRSRAGRALVESLVSLVLLGGGAIMLSTGIRASALLGVHARRANESQRVQAAIVEPVIRGACDSAAAVPVAPVWKEPALTLDITHSAQPLLQRVQTRVRWRVSPFAAGGGVPAEQALVVSSAVTCR